MRTNAVSLSLIITALLFPGCVTVQRTTMTASGKPEVTINGTTTSEVSSELVRDMSTRGFSVIQQSSNNLFFSKQMTGGQSIAAQLLIGNSYSTTPESEVRFMISENAANVLVIADMSMSTQMAFGQVKRQNMNHNNAWFNDVQSLLDSIRMRLERVTTSETTTPPPDTPSAGHEHDRAAVNSEKPSLEPVLDSSIPDSTSTPAAEISIPATILAREAPTIVNETTVTFGELSWEYAGSSYGAFPVKLNIEGTSISDTLKRGEKNLHSLASGRYSLVVEDVATGKSNQPNWAPHAVELSIEREELTRIVVMTNPKNNNATIEIAIFRGAELAQRRLIPAD